MVRVSNFFMGVVLSEKKNTQVFTNSPGEAGDGVDSVRKKTDGDEKTCWVVSFRAWTSVLVMSMYMPSSWPAVSKICMRP